MQSEQEARAVQVVRAMLPDTSLEPVEYGSPAYQDLLVEFQTTDRVVLWLLESLGLAPIRSL